MSYQDRLRVVGQQLDRGRYRAIVIIEVEGGLLVRATPHGSNLPAMLEILDSDFAKLLATHHRWRGWRERRTRNSLLPTGYEDFLRALGYWLDSEGASWVTISELVSMIAVHGWTGREGYRGVQVVPFELFLTGEDIETHLEEAFRRRKPRRRL